MVRSSKGAATRERIVDAARELFYLHGYNATGLDRIIERAGVTKGNFYHHFKSKEELALASLERQYQAIQTAIEERLAGHPGTPLERLLTVLEAMAERQRAQFENGHLCGCYFGNFTLELSTSSEAVRERVREILHRYLDLFRELLEQARQGGQLPTGFDATRGAETILSLMEGALLLDKAEQRPRAVPTAITFVRDYLLGAAPRPEP